MKYRLAFTGCLAAFVSLMVHVSEAQAGSPLSASAPAAARLTIVNPYHQQVPEDRVRVLLLTTCRVVAEEFRRHPTDVELRMTLVIGDADEHSLVDPDGHFTLYLDHWNEGKFVNGVITGAMQQLTPLKTRSKMWKDIVRRSDQIAPVSVSQLRDHGVIPPSPGLGWQPDCISALREGPCPWLNGRVPPR